MNHIVVNGLEASYFIEGEGIPLFMIHGWGGKKEAFNILLNELRERGVLKRRKVIVMDLPGFGDSEEPKKSWAVADYTFWFENFIKAIYKVEDIKGDYDLLVHSFGGRILFKLFCPQYKKVNKFKPDKLILVAAAGIKPKLTLRMRVAKLIAKTGKAILMVPLLSFLAPFARKVLYKILKSHDYERSSGVMRDTFIKVIDEDLVECLDHIIDNPTLIFWGERDSYVPLSDGIKINKSIPNSSLITIKDGRHGIHKTHANLLAANIDIFLT